MQLNQEELLISFCSTCSLRMIEREDSHPDFLNLLQHRSKDFATDMKRQQCRRGWSTGARQSSNLETFEWFEGDKLRICNPWWDIRIELLELYFWVETLIICSTFSSTAKSVCLGLGSRNRGQIRKARLLYFSFPENLGISLLLASESTPTSLNHC